MVLIDSSHEDEIEPYRRYYGDSPEGDWVDGGDLIDIWQLRRARYWPQEHNDVMQKILRKARKGTRVIYIPGNHDEFLSDFYGVYGNITIQKYAIHRTADGRKILIIHGHELDTVVQNVKWLAFAGDLGYHFLLSR